ncbi:hypothetical protein GQ55_9G392300 [Panicum hallii var. hallii]|uniref:Myb-like domain-containing protein n=1 Tax=Panicum hallii var. hallii TaxID=1504633 RepID=A0A2T7C9N3_9POAL|nr:hypothetical protein GQ55_9G392300 [Panicum hallii var. hallii]
MGHPSPARVTVRPTTLAHQAKCRKERRRQSARSGVLVRPGLADGRESGRRQRRGSRMDLNGTGSSSMMQGSHNQEGDGAPQQLYPQAVAVQFAQGQFMYPNDQWNFMVPGNVQNSAANEIQVGEEHPQQLNGQDDLVTHITTEENAVTSKSKIPAKGKKVARRGSGFSKEEDKIICSAFLNISKDPITGVNQSSGGYYKRIHDYYKQHKPEGSERSQIAIQHRWAAIQKAVNKFCGFKSAVDHRDQSGTNEQDRIDEAIKMFEKMNLSPIYIAGSC